MRSAQQQTNQTMQQGAGATQAATLAAQNYNSALSAVQASLARLNGAAGAAVGGLRTVGGAINQYVTTAAQRGAAALGTLGGAIRGVGRSAASAIGGLTTLGAVATAAFGVGAIREAANFEAQLAVINTIAHVGREELYQLGESLQDSAVRSGLAIEDMTAAQYEFLSAGIGLFKEYNKQTGQITETFDVAESAQAIDAAARLAVGGLSSQTEAVTLLSFALNAYGLNTKVISEATAEQAGVFYESANGVREFAGSMGEASDVIADQFSKAIEIGVVTAQEIAGSFATVASSAKIAGIGIDEISAAYAQQTVRGVSAARTTVSMNRAIQDLIQPSKGLRDLMEQTGKNYARIADTRGIHVAFQEMRTDANRLGFEYRDLFKRQEGWRFALNVTQDDLKDATGNFNLYERVLAEVRQAEDAAQQQMEERSDTVQRNFARLRLAFKILQEAVGRPLLQPVNEFLKAMTNIVVGLYDWARANQELIKSIAPIVGVVAGLLSLAAGTQGLLYVLVRVAPAIGATGTGLSSLARAVSILAVPLGIVVGLLGAFQYAVSNNIAGFGRFGRELSAMHNIVSGLVDAFGQVVESAQRVWGLLTQGANIGAQVRYEMDQIGQAFEDVGGEIEIAGRFIIEFFLGLAQTIGQVLANVGPVIINWAAGVVRTIVPAMARVGVALTRWVLDAIPPTVAALGQFTREVAANIADAVPQVIAAAAVLSRALTRWVSDAIPDVIAALGDLATEVAQWFVETVPVIVAAVRNWLGAVGREARQLLRNVTETLRDTQIVRQIASAVATWAAAVLAGLAALAVAVGQWIVRNVDRIVGFFIEVAQQIVAGLIDFFSNAAPRVAEVGVTILGAIAEAIRSNPGGIAQALLTLAVAGVVIQAAVTVGRAIAVAMFVGRWWFDTMLIQIGGALSRTWAALIPNVGGAVRTGAAHGAAYARSFALVEALIGRLSAVWSAIATRLAPRVIAAAAANGLAYAGSFAASVLGWNWVAGLFAPLVARLAPAAVATGTATGTAAGGAAAAAAFASAVAWAAAAPAIVFYAVVEFLPRELGGDLPGLKMPWDVINETEQRASDLAEAVRATSAEAATAVDNLRKQQILGVITMEQYNNQISTWARQLGLTVSPIDVWTDKIGGMAGALGDALGDVDWSGLRPPDDFGFEPIDFSTLFQNAPTSAQEQLSEARENVRQQLGLINTDLLTLSDNVEEQIRQIREGTSKSDRERLRDARRVRNAIKAELKEAIEAGDYTRAAALEKQLAEARENVSALEHAKEIYEATREELKGQPTTAERLLEEEKKILELEKQVIAEQNARHRRRRSGPLIGDMPGDPGSRTPTVTLPTPTQAQIQEATSPYRLLKEGIVARFEETSTSAREELDKIPPAARRTANRALSPYRLLKEGVVARFEETATGARTELNKIPVAAGRSGRRSITPYQQLKERATREFEGLQTGARDEMNKIPRSATTAANRAGDNINTGISGKKPTIFGTIGDIGRGIISRLTGINLFGAGQEIIQSLLRGISSVANNVAGVIGNIAGIIAGAFPSSPAKWGPLRAAPRWGPELVSQLTSGIQASTSMAAAAANDLATAISAPLDVAVPDFSTSINAALTSTQNLQAAIDPVTVPVVAEFGDSLVASSTGFANALLGAVPNFTNALVGAVPTFGNAISAAVRSGGGALISSATRFGDVLSDAIPRLGNALGAAVPRFGDALRTGIPDFVNALVGAVPRFGDALRGVVPAFGDAVVGAANATGNVLRRAATTFSDVLADVPTDIPIRPDFGNTLSQIEGALTEPVGRVGNVLSVSVADFERALAASVATPRSVPVTPDFGNSLTNAVADPLTVPVTPNFGNAFERAVPAFGSALADVIPQFRDALTTAVERPLAVPLIAEFGNSLSAAVSRPLTVPVKPDFGMPFNAAFDKEKPRTVPILPVFDRGPRKIAPLNMGRGYGYAPGEDPEHRARQTELLAEIAGATRLGAAASARSASRDPRAGGPLAAKTTLQALKQVTVTRTRG